MKRLVCILLLVLWIGPVYAEDGEGHPLTVDDIFPSATHMGLLSLEKYNNKYFEDVAYFEPFYLKDFVVGKKN